jgi:hypothetical protein
LRKDERRREGEKERKREGEKEIDEISTLQLCNFATQ